MMNNIGKFASRLREVMEYGIDGKSGFTQGEIAEVMGVKRQAVSQYCNGVTVPTVDKLEKLADYLGLSTDYLLGRTDAPTPPPVHRDTDILYASTVTGLPLKLVEALASMKDDSSFSVGKITKNYILIDIRKRVLNDETDA